MPGRHETSQKEIVSSYGQFLQLLLNRLQRPHDELWDGITAEEAPMARAAIVRAQHLRSTNADPGDTYLAGIAAGFDLHRTIMSLDSKSIEEATDAGKPRLELVAIDESGGADQQLAV